ncbi:MAG TPA: alpha/beta hydrolase-fold protein [Rhizomicrobium sp.]|jgi:enterochelin esterase-like enzyme|nr:alpha/beta hydrolase-fold protein [Rhizomicrobium sp.]
MTAATGAPERDEFVIGPDYAPAPEFAVQAGVPQGTVHAFTMQSSDSALYPGIRRLENDITKRRDAYGNRVAAAEREQSEPYPYTRTVWVYVPRQYVPGTAAPFMVVQDGYGYLNRLPRVLDNLIAQKRVPALIAILIDNGGGDAQGSERGLEYDTMSGRYSDFVETEVLPRVAKAYGIAFTADPDGRATMGASSGAACAFTMAWFHPERYHRVLSYSGTFVNQQSPPSADTPRGAWEYHAHLIAEAPAKPIRIWLEVGEKDLHYDDPEETWHNWPLANRRMADVLKAKGYAYRYVLAKAAVHVDARVTEQTLPGALEWLWRGYRG